MGDMSKCPHGGYVGYCEECSPGWEMEFIKADAIDIIYQRAYNRGYDHGYAKAVEDTKNTVQEENGK